MYKKIGVAVAFSPNCEAILSEAARLQCQFDAELVLIHVGNDEEEEKKFLDELVMKSAINTARLKIVLKKGGPAKKILSVCEKEKVDLLVAGALQRENIVKFYFGSIARKLIRKAKCSVMILINPTVPPQPFKRIVIDGTEGGDYTDTIRNGIRFAKLEKAHFVHIFKCIKLFGLSMAIAGEEENEKEQEETRRKILADETREIRSLLKDIDTKGLRVVIKVASGKPGFELRRYTEKVKADLLIVRSPAHKFNILDRIFPHDLELIIGDLPSNILIDKA